MRFTLDSNILIGYLNSDTRIADALLAWRKQQAHFFLSVITEIEVLSLSRLSTSERAEIERFLSTFTVPTTIGLE